MRGTKVRSEARAWTWETIRVHHSWENFWTNSVEAVSKPKKFIDAVLESMMVILKGKRFDEYLPYIHLLMLQISESVIPISLCLSSTHVLILLLAQHHVQPIYWGSSFCSILKLEVEFSLTIGDLKQNDPLIVSCIISGLRLHATNRHLWSSYYWVCWLFS